MGSPKVRILLAALLLEPGRVVSVDSLKDALWGGAPPVSAQASLHNHVTRLRRLLDDSDRLRAVPPGYVLRVDHGELDVHVFDARVAEARAAHALRDWPGVVRACAAALALWRGTPFSGLPADVGGYALVQRLEQARLFLLEWRYDAELSLGGARVAALVPELTALIAEHPLREAYHRQLMLALHRTGRQAEALAVHRDLRTRLVEELGIEPGAAVREAHVEILRSSDEAQPRREPVGDRRWPQESVDDRQWGRETVGDRRWRREVRGDQSWRREVQGDRSWQQEDQGDRSWQREAAGERRAVRQDGRPEADGELTADTAGKATASTSADRAASADRATSADRAASADPATSADRAASADPATSPEPSTSAGQGGSKVSSPCEPSVSPASNGAPDTPGTPGTPDRLGTPGSPDAADASGTPQTGAVPVARQTPRPAQLPAPPAHFTGRDDVCRELGRALAEPSAPAPAVVVISGMAGVGKSALALHVAHELREGFTDGQLYVNLHGATPGMTPLTPAQALAALLRDLGVDPRNVPEHPDASSALLRSLLAPARILLVLDDAANAAQVRPLLPAGPGCAVIVTSRSPLTTLDGARRFPLSPLTGEDSAALLRAVSGRPGLDATHALVELTGRLPLALRVVAARLAARRALTPDVLAGQLADTDGRLRHLEYDDLSVRRSLAVAHDALAAAEREADRDAARALRRIGALDLPTYGAPLIARLTGTDERRAEAALDRLVDVALLEETAYGRYAPHDLVRHFARELAEAAEPRPAAPSPPAAPQPVVAPPPPAAATPSGAEATGTTPTTAATST
ncbi:BTAD domain-containing putative transcriptional regulator, partial [Streptomyces sp. SID486]|uniref:AfsR/SARP family transcriptional regulator n=1 Tax=Streptomyces sp. SID486 TaxID=2690264 RepID=UPI0031F6F953